MLQHTPSQTLPNPSETSDFSHCRVDIEDGSSNLPAGCLNNPDHPKQRFLKSLMFRIRFGSTTETRFGAYVVRPKDAVGVASDAARGGRT